MKRLQIKFLTAGLAALFIISFLYIKTQPIDVDTHNRILTHISQFKQVDAVLNQQVLEIQLGLLPYYDPTVNSLLQLQQLQVELEKLMLKLCDTTAKAIEQHSLHLKKTLIQKRETLELFKSHSAIIKNSLHYLPVATAQVVDKLPDNKKYSDLRQSIEVLLRNIMIYYLNSDSELEEKLQNDISRLHKALSQVPKNTQKSFSLFLSHASIILDNKHQLNNLLQHLLTPTNTKSINALLKAYLIEYNTMVHSSNTYRLLLYGFTILLLGFIGYILIRMSRAAKILRRAVTDLNYQKFALDQHAIVSITDKDGYITYANQKFCDLSHRSLKELIGCNHRILKSDLHPPSFYKDLWQTITQGNVWRGNFYNRAKDGRLYCVDTTIVPFSDKKGIPYQYVAIRSDITDIKKAEEKLRIQATALKLAANGIVITDENGKIQWVNEAYTQLTGFERDEVIGKTPAIQKSGKHEPEFYQAIWQTIHDKQVWHGQLINKRKDGSFYTEEQTISPVYNDNGDTTHYIAIKLDITDRLQSEEALRRSQKMEAIGQLSGGIAHDFNNQLGIILGYLDFLKTLYPHDGKPRQWIETATKATIRCTDLTRQLLAFSRRQSSENSVVNLNTSLAELQTMIARSLTPEVKVQYLLDDHLWNTEINEGEFQDVILNLTINARDAMPHGGELLIETNNVYIDKDYARVNYDAKAGDYVQLMISDTGTGMDQETLEHVFEPFFTTKAKDKGTGLGLAMVYGFVQRYHGHINIYSELNIGTTIRIYLPRGNSSETTTDSSTQDDKINELPTGNETILLVDDEVDLLRLSRLYLTELGYQTRSAENAQEALKILTEDDSIDLLFSDVVMPGGINGFELAEKAAQQYPDLKILLTSGFTSKTITQKTYPQLTKQLLRKPYRKAEVAQRIRQVLDDEANV